MSIAARDIFNNQGKWLGSSVAPQRCYDKTKSLLGGVGFNLRSAFLLSVFILHFKRDLEI